jgi:hypothetical protein
MSTFKTNIDSIINKVRAWVAVNNCPEQFIYADYYNGSTNDAENIFIELKKLIEGDHFHHHGYFHGRLNYLISEGIDVSSIQTKAIEKLDKTESKKSKTKVEVVKKDIKKPKKVKKKAKAYKPKRDKLGRFVKASR